MNPNLGRLLLLCLALNLSAAELPFPVPTLDTRNEYLREAIQFVNQNPDSPHTPRVLVDMLMVFRAAKNQTEVDKVRTNLIAQYPDTLEGRFAISLFEDAKEYREMLLKMFNQDEKGSQTGFGRAFILRAMVGKEVFDNDVFKDAEVLTRSVFGAEEAGEVRFKDQLLELIRAGKVGNDNEKRLMKIAFDNELDHAQKIRAIDQQETCGTSRFLTTYLMSRLTEEERESFPIRRIFIENKLKSSKWDEAMEVIDAIPTKKLDALHQAQLQFWKAWALSASGDVAAADKLFGRLAAGRATTPWHRLARSFNGVGLQREENLEANAVALKALIGTLAPGIEVFEGTLNLQTKDAVRFTIYVSYEGQQDELQLFVQREGETRLAYSFSPKRSQMYTGADGTTIIGEGSMPTFTPQFEVKENDTGGFAFNASGQTAESLAASKSSLMALLDSPMIGTHAGRRKVIGRLTEQGWTPLAPKQTDSGQTFDWIVPHTDRAKLKQIRITAGEDGRLRSVESEDEYRFECRYGKAEQNKLQPPAWPKAREKKVGKEEFGFALVSKFMPAIMELATP